MNILEYFDYEKQLLCDYQAVKTPHAKTAVFKTLMSTLDMHKEFVFNTISSFENSLANARKDIQKVYNNQTPKYVTDMMAEFGFREAEDVERGQEDSADSILDRDTYNKLVGKNPAGPRPAFVDGNQPEQLKQSEQSEQSGRPKRKKRRQARGKKTETDKVQEMLERARA